MLKIFQMGRSNWKNKHILFSECVYMFKKAQIALFWTSFSLWHCHKTLPNNEGYLGYTSIFMHIQLSYCWLIIPDHIPSLHQHVLSSNNGRFSQESVVSPYLFGTTHSIVHRLKPFSADAKITGNKQKDLVKSQQNQHWKATSRWVGSHQNHFLSTKSGYPPGIKHG